MALLRPPAAGEIKGYAAGLIAAGLDDELSRLNRMLNTDAPERTVIIVGEPGIGKSALLAALLDGARGRAVVLAGRCDPLGRDLPLQPLLDGLEVLLRVVERAGAAADGAAARIVIDDLHLAGPSTVAWLRFAARRSERLRLVLASRPSPVPAPDGAGRIDLGPLDLAAAGQLARSFLIFAALRGCDKARWRVRP
ncbi:MAG: AAA family ATPase [Actinomycetota bacterium]|nr:AAA family ATPase [Actinomycetota bacterium]